MPVLLLAFSFVFCCCFVCAGISVVNDGDEVDSTDSAVVAANYERIKFRDGSSGRVARAVSRELPFVL